MSHILVSGSWAYDNLMEYDGLLKNAILPEKLDHLSVGFTVSKKTVQFGGCAGNIAYTLKLLGIDAVAVGLIGKDFEQYFHWLNENGIDASHLITIENEFTASAYILTDQKQNQIQIFHGGAMLADSEKIRVKDYIHEKDRGDSWVMIAPDDWHRMVRLTKECRAMNVKYIFDPSQQISNMDATSLRDAIQQATILIANEYETDLISQKLGITRDELTNMVETFIETHGEKGSTVTRRSQNGKPGLGEEKYFIKSVKPKAVVDPTGCGDAFRAGLLYGLSSGMHIEKSCQQGALAATYVLEHKGTQNHFFSMKDFQKRFEENFS